MRHQALCIVAVILSVSTMVSAQPAAGPALMRSEVTGKTGAFQLTLTERSPLSAPGEIAQRLKLKPEGLGTDYDLSKQIFDVYVPAAPDENGKYGLLVALAYADGHGFAPAAWRLVLEKHHLIWIGPTSGGDGHPALERIGQALDSVSNARKTWPIDDRRLYLSMNVSADIVSGVGLNYADVFSGVLNTGPLQWFAGIHDEKRNATWDTNHFPRPQDQYLGQAKSRRFYLAVRDDGENSTASSELVYRRGYQQAGFKNIKFVKVPQANQYLWSNWSNDWFEEGIQFLDAGVSEAQATTKPATPTASPFDAIPLPGKPDVETKAAQALTLAENYLAIKKYELARTKLQQIIDTYPRTTSAGKAQALLKEIEGK